ncbi:FAST kinase domain-containing protein 4-like [Littorina saxatilis]|uniref:FAST kinase-like protein subdomain 2 domain-containing protein n=1 Tax=Littorina saxatilis TaxID=31220 RepID=A0AAN9ATL9_9CAEN
MLPSQATAPLRRILGPCLRLYQNHHPSPCGFAGTLTDNPKQVFTSVSTPSTSQTVYFASHSGPQGTKAFSTSCTFCDIVREQAEEVEKKSLKFENGEKVQAFSTASFENLISLAQKVESGHQALLILQRLCVLHKEGKTQCADGEILLQDARLSKVSQVLDEQIMRLSPKVLITTLKALYEVSDADVYIVKTLATQLLWLLRRLPMASLIQVLQLHLSHQETSLREGLVKQTMTTLERRWVELTSPKDIIFLMYTIQGGETASQTLMERLEDRALDTVENASPKELYRIIYLLSRQRHRNTPLIRAAVYHLNKTSLSSLSAVQLTNLVYALCVLSVYDVSILKTVSAELPKKQADLTPKLAASLMMSFSRLRWKESKAVQIILDVIEGESKQSEKNETADISNDSSRIASALDSLDASGKAGLVLSLANLHLDTQQSRAMIERVVRLPEMSALQRSAPLQWLDVVWSLAVFQMLDAKAAASVLAEDFWGSLPGTDSFQSVVNLMKVNNINTAARLELEGYTGPFLPPTITTADAKSLQRGERKVTELLVSALANFAPLESYTLTNTTATGGYLIDAEFYVDNNGDPKPLSQVQQNSSDCHRVALKVLEFPDLTLPTSDPTGLHAMAARHLHSQGYVPVEVNHMEVAGKTKVVELVQFLQQKVKDALKVKDSAKVNTTSQTVT